MKILRDSERAHPRILVKEKNMNALQKKKNKKKINKINKHEKIGERRYDNSSERHFLYLKMFPFKYNLLRICQQIII